MRTWRIRRTTPSPWRSCAGNLRDDSERRGCRNRARGRVEGIAHTVGIDLSCFALKAVWTPLERGEGL